MLKNPMVIGEALAQGVSDGLDQKGTAYCVGYVGGVVVTSVAADKGLSKLGKMAKGTKALGRTEDVAKAAVKAEDVVTDSLDDLVNTSRKSTKMTWDERGVGIREGGSNFKGQQYNGTRNTKVDFVNGKGKSTLNKHAGKHGYTSPEEYLKDARYFMEKTPTSTTQSFVSNEGTYFRYDTATNEFGIINEYGGISTYFNPEDGIAYWLEQINKYAPK